MIDPDTPEILRQFLAYHETIKGQSPKTIDEYHLDLRMFLRFLVLMRSQMPNDTDLETISVRCVGTRAEAFGHQVVFQIPDHPHEAA